MPSSTAPVRAPAGFVPEYAVAFGTENSPATPVDASNPLPVAAMLAAATSTPLTGTTATAVTVGPFVPQLGRPIWLVLSGTWAGTAQLLRSTDGGTTRLPLTIAGQGWGTYSANCNEPAAEESAAAATYYLALAPTSGSIAYQVAQ